MFVYTEAESHCSTLCQRGPSFCQWLSGMIYFFK